MTYGMVAVALLSCIISFIASIVAGRCAADGDGNCGKTAGIVASVAGVFAAAAIGVSMYNAKRGGGAFGGGVVI